MPITSARAILGRGLRKGRERVDIMSRANFPILPRSPSSRTNTPCRSPRLSPMNLSELRDMAYGWGKIVSRRALR